MGRGGGSGGRSGGGGGGGDGARVSSVSAPTASPTENMSPSQVREFNSLNNRANNADARANTLRREFL